MKEIAINSAKLFCVIIGVVFALAVVLLGIIWLCMLLFGNSIFANAVTVLLISAALTVAFQAVRPEFQPWTEPAATKEEKADGK